MYHEMDRLTQVQTSQRLQLLLLLENKEAHVMGLKIVFNKLGALRETFAKSELTILKSVSRKLRSADKNFRRRPEYEYRVLSAPAKASERLERATGARQTFAGHRDGNDEDVDVACAQKQVADGADAQALGAAASTKKTQWKEMRGRRAVRSNGGN